MINEALRDELLAMAKQDRQVRQALVESGELGGHYVPKHGSRAHPERCEAKRNRQGVLPDSQRVGEDGAEAAWYILQHAIGFPDLQRSCLSLLKNASG